MELQKGRTQGCLYQFLAGFKILGGPATILTKSPSELHFAGIAISRIE